MWQSVKSQARFQLRFCAFVVRTYRLKFISRHPKLRSKCYNHIHDMIWYQIILHLNLQSQHWCKKGAFSIKANRNMIEAKLQQGAWGKSGVIVIHWDWGCPEYLKDPQLGTNNIDPIPNHTFWINQRKGCQKMQKYGLLPSPLDKLARLTVIWICEFE